MSTVYECIGKGGEYLIVATAFGAGTLRHDEATVLIVYKDRDGVHYVRTEEDFGMRMQAIGGDSSCPHGVWDMACKECYELEACKDIAEHNARAFADILRDAQRYRWLKENATDAGMWDDASIDAAMEE